MAQPLTCPQCGQDKVFRSPLLDSHGAVAVARLHVTRFIASHAAFVSRRPFGYQYPARRLIVASILRIPVRLFCRFPGKVRGGRCRIFQWAVVTGESQASVHEDDIFYLQIVLENEPGSHRSRCHGQIGEFSRYRLQISAVSQENKRLLAFVANQDGLGRTSFSSLTTLRYAASPPRIPRNFRRSRSILLRVEFPRQRAVGVFRKTFVFRIDRNLL